MLAVGRSPSRLSWSRALGAVIIFGLAGGFVLAVLASPAERQGFAQGGVPCLFRTVTHLPCPLCGMTHALLALAGGHFRDALAAYPLLPVALALMVWGGWVLFRGGAVGGSRRAVVITTVALGAAWAVNLLTG